MLVLLLSQRDCRLVFQSDAKRYRISEPVLGTLAQNQPSRRSIGQLAKPPLGRPPSRRAERTRGAPVEF